jgi:glycosyltransferase involved in cell wall biosynthesis
MSRRILYINTPSYIGGAEVSLLTLMSHLDPSRYQAQLLTSSAGSLTESAGQLGIPTHIYPLPGLSRRHPYPHLSSILRLTRTIRQQRIVLLHTNCDASLLPARYAARLAHVPFVSHVRDFVRYWFLPRNLAGLKKAEVVIANSTAIARACQASGISAYRLRTIYNPIDIDTFSTVTAVAAARFRNEIECPVDAPLIGLIGQVQAIKGHREFMQAALRLAASNETTHFVIVGSATGADDQAFAREMEEIATSSPFSNRFHFIGYRTDVPVIMQALDILVVPSWNEPFGRVVVEGMAAGRAVIGTNAGGIPEIITTEVDGILVPPRDSDALQSAILRLLNERDIRSQFGLQAQLTARRFTIDQHVEQMQALYDAVLAQ